MGRTYFALLRALEARRFRVFGGRVSLPADRSSRSRCAAGCAPGGSAGARLRARGASDRARRRWRRRHERVEGSPGACYTPRMTEATASTTRLREIVLGGPRGFCAGVDRAIDIVELALEVCPHPVYVRKEIVHNRHVVEALRAKGAHFVDELHEVPDDATVIFSAHGISPAVRDEAQRRGPARHRRDVPARHQGASRGHPLRARGLLDHPRRPRRPRRGGGDHGRGAGPHVPDRASARTWIASPSPTPTRSRT